jgi:hypothetical protein
MGRVCRVDLRDGPRFVRRFIPDFATFDRAPVGLSDDHGILAMGWRGSARHWHRYETAYLLAGLATPLFFGPQSRFRLAVSIIPAGTQRFSRLLLARFMQVRHGLITDDPTTQVLRTRRLHHDAPHAQHGKGHVGDGTDVFTAMEAFWHTAATRTKSS